MVTKFGKKERTYVIEAVAGRKEVFNLTATDLSYDIYHNGTARQIVSIFEKMLERTLTSMKSNDCKKITLIAKWE